MRALTDDERRIILLVKLYQKENRHGPPWSWIREQSGLSRAETTHYLRRLRKTRAIIFKHGVMHSTIATNKGVEAALHPENGEDPQ